MAKETLKEKIMRQFFTPRNEFAHKHNPLKLNAEYKKDGYSKKDSDGIARYYHEIFYAPVMNLTNYLGLENKIKELEGHNFLLIIGFAGVIISFILSSLNLTGFFILEKNCPQTYFASIVIFLISIFLIILRKKIWQFLKNDTPKNS